MANKLLHEQSLYLRQHAHNPVDWEPWGDAAFARAQKEDKPLIVSIGYAACHWCHVMERESFENEEVAAFMNEHFICIKVDREEHPDVDQLYMDAVQAINGNGGWPLNVFVTPDRIPFYGGTYFPPRPVYGRPSWMQVLSRMNEIWTQQRTEVDAQSRQMFSYLQQASAIAMNAEPAAFDMATCRDIAEALLKQADTEEGGFGNAPKFPATMAISYLLEHYLYTSYEPALKQALLSLDKMIDGGIYDQLGGGFARYATDRNWLVPHFEKMLYDNALLVISLCDAFSITKDDKYRRVALETLEFCERELRHESGGYYCSLDADSEGEEGKFYTWTSAEWEALPAGDFDVVKAYYGVSEEGNWEGTNILHVSGPEEVLAERLDMSVSELKNKIAEAKELLLNERSKRVRPVTDDKCLLSWNALMNQALSKAAKTFGDNTLSLTAEEHMKWMLSSFRSGGNLLHSWREGKAAIPAKLDDYAYLLKALLSLASVSGKNELIVTAKELAEEIFAGFVHEAGSFFYYSSLAQTDIAVRKVDIYDGATPSANAVMAENLLWLAMCMERFDWQEQAEFMLRQMAQTTSRYAASFANWGIVLQRYVQGLKTVVFTGANSVPAATEFMQLPIPHTLPLTVKKEIFEVPLIADKKSASDLLIFVCTQQACLQPVRSIEETLHLTNR